MSLGVCSEIWFACGVCMRIASIYFDMVLLAGGNGERGALWGGA